MPKGSFHDTLETRGRLRGAESADEFAGWRDLPPRLHAPEQPAWPLDLARLLHRLRLPHVREAGPAILARAQDEGWDYAQVLKVLLAEEAAGRDRSTRELHRREARLPSGKTFEAWDPKASAIPDEAQWALRSLDWMGRAENLVLVGPSGTGKSHFAEAIAHAAIDRDLRVSWFSLESLTATIARSRIDASTGKVVERIVRSELVVVDDIGLLPAGPEEAEALYRLVDAAYEKTLTDRYVQPAPGAVRHDLPQGSGHGCCRPAPPPRPCHRHRRPITSAHRGHRRPRRQAAAPCS
jgi:DNA replication protein DnaC